MESRQIFVGFSLKANWIFDMSYKKNHLTRGMVSSERKAAYHAFIASVALGCFILWKIPSESIDLVGAGVFVGAIVLPLSGLYPATRMAKKLKHGEAE